MGVERVLRDGHHHRIALHTHLYEVETLVEQRVRISRCAKDLPQQAGHAIPVQASGVKMALLIHHNKNWIIHLPKDRRISDKLDKAI